MTQELTAALEELDVPGPQAKAIHRCRVHLKRARALARVGQTVAPGLAAVFNDSARTLMRQLGQTHDVAALADTARLLAETARHKGAAPLIQAADALETARDSMPDVDLESARAGVRDLLALAQVWPAPSTRQLRAGALRVVKRARRARSEGRGAGEASIRHRWRKREKDRLYAAALLSKAWPSQRKKKDASALGHVLGRERDATLLLERLEAEPSLAGGAAAADHARRIVRKHAKRLRRRANKLADRLSAEGV